MTRDGSAAPVDAALQDVANWLDEFFSHKRETSGVFFGRLIRAAIDHVIDGAETGRYSLTQLDVAERTYIGTRLQIILRLALEVAVGQTKDLLISDHDVDVKFSLNDSCMIGKQQVDALILLVSTDRSQRKFFVRLVRATRENLRAGKNQDSKTSLTAEAVRNAKLLVTGELPRNFVMDMGDSERERIFAHPGAQARIRELAILFPRRPLHRSTIESVGWGTKDPMRRVRKDKYKADVLGGMVCLSKYHHKILTKLGLELPDEEHFMFVPESDVDDLV